MKKKATPSSWRPGRTGSRNRVTRLEPSAPPGEAEDAGDAERRCILTGRRLDRDAMIRLVVGPEGQVVPDLAAKLGGRGAWIGLERKALEDALAQGRLKGAMARALKRDGKRLVIDTELSEMIVQGLKRRALSRLGLESKAGHLTFGFDRVMEVIRGGRAKGLLHAADGAVDGVAKLDGALSAMTPESWSLRLPSGRDDLGLALGRENMVHAAVIDSGAARRVWTEARRWLAFAGNSETEAEPKSKIGTVRE